MTFIHRARVRLSHRSPLINGHDNIYCISGCDMSRFEDFGVEYLQFVVSQSSSFADVLRRFEYAVSSDAYRLLKRTLQRNEIDYSHISIGVGSNKGRIFWTKKRH